MFSLFIDTHDSIVHFVLYKDGKILDQIHNESLNRHSAHTMPLLDALLKRNSLSVSSLGEIYVVNGPGSFTGERIAVTIAKTMAYCLQVPIKVIDSLTILAIQKDAKEQYVSILDKNGAYVGHFDSNYKVLSMTYYNNAQYKEFSKQHVVYSDLEIDYNKVFQYIQKLPTLVAHQVNPLYVKGISALNDK